MIELDKIYCCDCLEGMKAMPSDSVDMVVTSPPYDNLRTYNKDVDKTWSEHAWKPIIAELYRVTKQGGVVVWVVNDATINGSETGTSFRQALYAMECGFNLHDTMIYQKQNPIPQNHNRYEQSFEYMFVFSKGKPSTFNAIRVNTIHGGEQMNWGGRKTEMDANQCRRHREDEYLQVKKDKPHTNVFCYSIGGSNTGHPAVFPLQLAHDHILSWSNEGDTVLDPFMGSGTTAIACIKEKRHFVGFELNEDYYKIACRRIDDEKRQLKLF